MKILETAQIGGIKCDNPNCNYVDMSVKTSEYPDYVNKPCPCCSSTLLTEEDFDSFAKTMRTMRRFDTVLYYILCPIKAIKDKIKGRTEEEETLVRKKDDVDKASFSINWDGSGQRIFEIKKKA